MNTQRLLRIRLVGILIGLFLINNSALAFGLLNKSGNKEYFAGVSATGDWLLVMVWSHDCIPCEQQKPMISKFASLNQGKGIRVLGLSSDDREYIEEARKIIKGSKTDFDNYLYNGDGFSNDYKNMTGKRFLATPTYLVYGPKGMLDGVHVGPIKYRILMEYFADKKREIPASYNVDLFR